MGLKSNKSNRNRTLSSPRKQARKIPRRTHLSKVAVLSLSKESPSRLSEPAPGVRGSPRERQRVRQGWEQGPLEEDSGEPSFVLHPLLRPSAKDREPFSLKSCQRSRPSCSHFLSLLSPTPRFSFTGKGFTHDRLYHVSFGACSGVGPEHFPSQRYAWNHPRKK